MRVAKNLFAGCLLLMVGFYAFFGSFSEEAGIRLRRKKEERQRGRQFLGGSIRSSDVATGIELEYCVRQPIEKVISSFDRIGLGCGALVEEGHPKDYSRPCWQITTDATMKCGSELISVELVSPILRLSAPGSLLQISNAVEQLDDMGAIISEKTGLHVHLDARNLTLNTLKALVLLYSTFEPLLQRLIPLGRQGNDRHWFFPIAGGDPYHLFSEASDSRTPSSAWRHQVRSASSIGQLVNLANPFGIPLKDQDRQNGYALSLINLLQHPGRKKGPFTVEFRLPGSTTDSELAVFWVLFAHRLLSAAVSMGESTTAYSTTAGIEQSDAQAVARSRAYWKNYGQSLWSDLTKEDFLKARNAMFEPDAESAVAAGGDASDGSPDEDGRGCFTLCRGTPPCSVVCRRQDVNQEAQAKDRPGSSLSLGHSETKRLAQRLISEVLLDDDLSNFASQRWPELFADAAYSSAVQVSEI